MIPKTLHRIWLGGPMPAMYDHGGRWARLLAGWDLRLWTEDDLDSTWTVVPLMADAERFSPKDHVRWRVDVWRLEILSRHGGIYVDCDARPLRPLDPLCDRQAFVAETPNLPGSATNAVMGATAGHPFLLSMLDGLAARAERMAGRRVVESVGGFYLTETLKRHPDVDLLPWWWFAGQSIDDRRAGLPKDPRNAAEGYIDHLYGNTARGRRG